jgi:hypothetical protein
MLLNDYTCLYHVYVLYANSPYHVLNRLTYTSKFTRIFDYEPIINPCPYIGFTVCY